MPGPAVPVSYQVNWEIKALDRAAGFLGDDLLAEQFVAPFHAHG